MDAAGVNWTVAQTYSVSKEALLEAVQICVEHGADINARLTKSLWYRKFRYGGDCAPCLAAGGGR